MKFLVLFVSSFFAVSAHAADCGEAAVYGKDITVCVGEKVILTGDSADGDQIPRVVEIVSIEHSTSLEGKVVGDPNGKIVQGSYVTKLGQRGPVPGFPNVTFSQPYKNPYGSEDRIVAHAKDLWGNEFYYVFLGNMGRLDKLPFEVVDARVNRRIGIPYTFEGVIYHLDFKYPGSDEEIIQREMSQNCAGSYGEDYENATNLKVEILRNDNRQEWYRECKIGLPDTCVVSGIKQYPQWVTSMSVRVQATCTSK